MYNFGGVDIYPKVRNLIHHHYIITINVTVRKIRISQIIESCHTIYKIISFLSCTYIFIIVIHCFFSRVT